MTKPISPLRQRMIDDMALRNMSPNTQKVYIAAVAKFARYFQQSPDKLGLENVRLYQLHLVNRGLKATSINAIVGGLRFFYRVTLKRKHIAQEIPFARKEETLPAVLTHDDVECLLRAVTNVKMRTALITVYATGLRVSEVVTLTAHDIDSARMVIHIRQAKGRKDRYVMLPTPLLKILRDYYRRARPQYYLFPGPDPICPLTTRSVQRVCRKAVQTAGLAESVTVHTLRHSFATHLLEQGVDIRVIQDLLGHRQITSTTRYARVAANVIRQVQSPLEFLNIDDAKPD